MHGTPTVLLNPHAPVLLVHWGGPDELDEIAMIQETLEEHHLELTPSDKALEEKVRCSAYYRYQYRRQRMLSGTAIDDWVAAERRIAAREQGIPFVEAVRVKEADEDTFLRTLKAALQEWTNRQLLYISCHGNFYQLSYALESGPYVSYAELSAVLCETLADEDAVALVLGSCEALGHSNPILDGLPGGIVGIYGFTEKPTSQNVAGLMAGVVADAQKLHQKLSEANEAQFGWGITGGAAIDDAFSQLKDRWEQVLDEDTEDPTYFVVGYRGGTVKALRRVEDSGSSYWQGYSVFLRPFERDVTRVPRGWST